MTFITQKVRPELVFLAHKIKLWTSFDAPLVPLSRVHFEDVNYNPGSTR